MSRSNRISFWPSQHEDVNRCPSSAHQTWCGLNMSTPLCFVLYIYIYICVSSHSILTHMVIFCYVHNFNWFKYHVWMVRSIHSASNQTSQQPHYLILEIWSGNWTSKTVLLWLTHKTQYLNCNNKKNIIIFVGRLELVRLFIFRMTGRLRVRLCFVWHYPAAYAAMCKLFVYACVGCKTIRTA